MADMADSSHHGGDRSPGGKRLQNPWGRILLVSPQGHAVSVFCFLSLLLLKRPWLLKIDL